MDWLQGPLSDQAVFWFGLKVFWWKRLITCVQLVLGSSILLTLVTGDQKRRLSEAWHRKRDRAEGIIVPPVIRTRTLLKWFVPVLAFVAALLGYLTHLLVRMNDQPVSFLAAGVFWLLILSLLALPIAEIVVAISMLRTGYRGFQRYAPVLLAWFLRHEMFDRNVTIAVFVSLVLVTMLQIRLS